MHYMTTSEIREKFLSYFSSLSRGHEVVESSSVVPANDPSLLFTNAGMVQFKDVFLGLDSRSYKRAVTVQKCLRVGGKHNDLEQVGFTKRHHTFFEMLGNFSFGDYFKEDAIFYAWRFLTEVLGIPTARLWVTVYKDDEESAAIWLDKVGIPKERLVYCGDEDNFWSMGDTGPCGPCTEIFYDHGDEVAGGPPGSVDAEGDRYVEVWNLVFMQYNRQVDQSLLPLPSPSVDTGMGLERIAAVMQGVSDNFDTDIFRSLLSSVAAIEPSLEIDIRASRVMADHIRSAVFLIADHVYPSNEGRGYVLRRIIRRAVRFGYKSGLAIPFFYSLVEPVLRQMGGFYPELCAKRGIITATIEREEKQFAQTLTHGLGVLEQAITEVKGGIISGEVAFSLYDTYGFPLDLTRDILEERGLTVDEDGYAVAMQRQRDLSKSVKSFSDMQRGSLDVGGVTEFLGYDQLEVTASIRGIFIDGIAVDHLTIEQRAILVLDRTVFYAESGGQVGDSGEIIIGDAKFLVSSTKKQGKVVLHHGILAGGSCKLGDNVIALVAAERQRIRINHTATHLLHSALREVLGGHVIQKGSLVDADRLRFDFSHHQPLTTVEINRVVDIVNTYISRAVAAKIELLDQAEAKRRGATALFEEKYEDIVRVISFADFSIELCGGTHVANTAELGCFKIINETGVAAGVRRIEAITGTAILRLLNERESLLANLSSILRCSSDDLLGKANVVVDQNRVLLAQERKNELITVSKEVDRLLESSSSDVKGVKFLRHIFKGLDIKGLRSALDQVKSKVSSGGIVVIFASRFSENKIFVLVYVAGVSFSARDILSELNAVAGGSGGGKDVLAQGFVVDFDKLSVFLASYVLK